MCFWLLWSAPSSSLANRRDSGTIDKICSTVAQLRKGPNTPKYSDGVFNLFTSALYWQVQRTQKGMIDFALLWQNRINPPGPRWETLPKVTSFFVCVCVHPPSTFLSVHTECDKWPRQSLMKRWDCPARHRAIISLRYTDSPKEKSRFNQPRLIWDKDERCLSGEGKNPTRHIISTAAAVIVITSTNVWK